MKRCAQSLAVVFALTGLLAQAAERGAAPVAEDSVRALVDKYCLDCHDEETMQGDLELTTALAGPTVLHPQIWEDVIRRLATRQMPPAKKKSRPSEAEYEAMLAALTGPLDAAARSQPAPGRTETLRRLNRIEYQNVIRDLLGLEIDAAALLPADEVSHGFDNVTVGTLSATLLERYITAAQKISRLAVGGEQWAPGGETIRIQPDLTQEQHVPGLPFGTRGGAVLRHFFPRTGEYDINIRLARDRNDEVEGLHAKHDMVVLLDGAEVQSFVVRPPAKGEGHNDLDKHLQFRLAVTAGPHQLGVTFLKNPSSVLEYARQPYEARFNVHRHPRSGPALYQVSIVGPQGASVTGDTPSRSRLFGAVPPAVTEDEARAGQVLATLLRRAWRRPVTAEDVERIMPFFREARQTGDFEAGIEAALSAVLVSREFLFRVEVPPPGTAPGAVYPLNDVDLATRLSFFLWSSIPDDELLACAERGELGQPEQYAQQARRMLADPRAQSLVSNFAAQWLHLRNLDSFTPDGRLFPDFDDNLRQAMRRETELLLLDIVREDRSVLDLLRADYTWLNERLAKHYGIPHVYGAHFRKVPVAAGVPRGGLLRQASVLTVTSYATRTSPVLRGKWVLENLLGTPPPPPGPDVPALDGTVVSEKLPIRQRLAAHRDDPACASCHDFIDPPGFALEHFDALGRWRVREVDQPVDASGGLPDGSTFVGVAGLEEGLIARPEVFVTTLSEKLLTFALGRGVEYYDGPAVREVVRSSGTNDYRFSAVILGLVNSPPFTMRKNL